MINRILFARTGELFLSLILILITLPVQIALAVILSLILRENPIFLQERGLTLGKFRFTMIKFRTIGTSHTNGMRTFCREEKFLIPGAGLKINKFTEWIRRTGLDELPQLYNVLFGQMNFIGPRPLMVRDLLIMKQEFPYYNRKREDIPSRPGITGLWQLFGHRLLGIENLLCLDLFYEENHSLKMDLKIILSTIRVVLTARNYDCSAPNR